MSSGFKSPAELGENTPIFTERQAYEMMKNVNKALWEGKEPKQQTQPEEKRSGFGFWK